MRKGKGPVGPPTPFSAMPLKLDFQEPRPWCRETWQSVPTRRLEELQYGFKRLAWRSSMSWKEPVVDKLGRYSGFVRYHYRHYRLRIRGAEWVW